MRKILALLVAVLMLTSGCNAPDTPAPYPSLQITPGQMDTPAATVVPSADLSVITDEEYAVMSVAIEDYVEFGLGTGYQVIILREITGLDVLDLQDLIHQLQTQQQANPGLSAQIIHDFQAKNEKEYVLDAGLDFRTPYVLLSQAEDLDMCVQLGPPACWETLQSSYPESRGPVTVSRVGFNPAMDRAVVYVGSTCCDSGGGQVVFLAKHDGTWQIQSRILMWIS